LERERSAEETRWREPEVAARREGSRNGLEEDNVKRKAAVRKRRCMERGGGRLRVWVPT
jgi:hypothetical protein